MISIIITLIIIGILLWAVQTYLPMDARIKGILNVVVIILVLLWLAGVFFGYRFPRG